MFVKSLIFLWFAEMCKGVIYHLNASEYGRMPAVYRVDAYEPCVARGGRYCSVSFELVADAPTALLRLIQEYSAQTPTHFNHSQLSYGICVPETCGHILHSNTTSDLNATLEACLNESLWRDYKLKAKLTDKVSCNRITAVSEEIDAVDLIVAVLFVGLLVCIVVGSLQEFVLDKNNKGNKWLACFSLRRNLKVLISPYGATDPRLLGMKGFHCLRVLSSVMVILCHGFMPFVLNADNPQQWEEAFSVLGFFASGMQLVQSFFLLSGFLLAFHVEVYRETRPITWPMLPLKIMQRYLRLIPPYAAVLAVKVTWFRFMAYGPFWQISAGQEVEDCRRDWWLILLFAINYVDNSQCMAETWYLSADMQLTIVGLAVCAMTSGRCRRHLLACLLLAGLLVLALHTYLQDLDSLVLFRPETARNFFVKDPTFNHVYKRGHTNLAGYVVGICSGLLAYNWQKTNFNSQKKLKYSVLLWSLWPLNWALQAAAARLHYWDAARPPPAVRVLCALLFRGVYCASMAAVLVALALRSDALAEIISRPTAWVYLSRVAYCAYVVHMFVIRAVAATRTSLVHVSAANVVTVQAALVATSFVAGAVLWLLVEAPLANVLRIYFRRNHSPSPNTGIGETKDTKVVSQANMLTITRRSGITDVKIVTDLSDGGPVKQLSDGDMGKSDNGKIVAENDLSTGTAARSADLTSS